VSSAIDRPAARLLVLDGENRLLLFRFAYAEGALAGNVFWAPPGGGLEPGETYEAAACRELLEETGLRIAQPGPAVAQREVSFMMPDGRRVRSDESYFLVRAPGLVVSSAGRSQEEHKTLVHHAWWTKAALSSVAEQVWPEDVAAMLEDAGVWR
jgi:8-oxo-dGTP diphosphatase